eukprot:CAMPEP_0194531884 /NCGR_PEP_ID=MMETSP0253-20130528/69266_1 /TAXON_ID=2966 /ORGANISM="Noctiluca scintillans" /LENGTH=372 /DNA_ID=CAMNT_0039377271 /DNA_START=42 /DNA_END=1160 /DNA_ORIENTATION=-
MAPADWSASAWSTWSGSRDTKADWNVSARDWNDSAPSLDRSHATKFEEALPEHLDSMSRSLAAVLRHRAQELGLRMRTDGSVLLSDVLGTKLLAPHVESLSPGSSKALSAHEVPASLLEAVETIVCTSVSGIRPRFELDKNSPTEMWIRATTKMSMPIAVPCDAGSTPGGQNIPGSVPVSSKCGEGALAKERGTCTASCKGVKYTPPRRAVNSIRRVRAWETRHGAAERSLDVDMAVAAREIPIAVRQLATTAPGSTMDLMLRLHDLCPDSDEGLRHLREAQRIRARLHPSVRSPWQEDEGPVHDSDDVAPDGNRRLDWMSLLGDDRFSQTGRDGAALLMLLKLLPADAPPRVREYLDTLLRPKVHYAAMCA